MDFGRRKKLFRFEGSWARVLKHKQEEGMGWVDGAHGETEGRFQEVW